MTATNVVNYRYNAVVTRVVDGDTIDVLIRYDVGFRQVVEWEHRIRLARVNAPERRGPERAAGLAATEWLQNLIPPGTVVWIETAKGDSFGRYIAEVYTDEQRLSKAVSVNTRLVDAGHATYRTY